MIKRKLHLLVLVLFLALSVSCRDSINGTADEGNGLEPPPDFGPGLTVESPKAGDIWAPGSRNEIKWEVAPNEFFVNILLYRKTEFKLTIAESVENTGSYMWRVPSGLAQSHHYRIHIEYSTNSYQRSFISDEFFVIE